MDAVSEPKRQKLSNMDGNIKGFNDLPDVVIQHIISLLPMKDAVRTSVLSKRWEYLWTSIPNLEFDEKNFSNRTIFLNFVERALVLRESNINTFYLHCNVREDASRIKSWISAAVRHNVEDCFISHRSGKEPSELPHCLFTCGTLTRLVLWTEIIPKSLPSVSLSRLRILTLVGVIFQDDHSTQQLFSGIPVLEELNLVRCDLMNLTCMSISSPLLCSLEIREKPIDEVNWNGAYSCEVIIYGSCLKYFGYSGELLNDYCLHNTSSLEVANISVISWGTRLSQVANRSYKLLTGLSNAKELVLSWHAVEVLNNAAKFPSHLPLFDKLTDLELNLSKVDCEILFKLLQNCPCLTTLELKEGIWLQPSIWEYDGDLDPVPPCFSSHLKSVQIEEFLGVEEEMHAVKILLKNATVLDKISILCSEDFSWESKEQQQVGESLLGLPRGSKGCEVIFASILETSF